MPPRCHRKVRFPTREFAQAQVVALVADSRDHHLRAARIQSYWCIYHQCWHVGHGDAVTEKPWLGRSLKIETIGFLESRRKALIVEHGETKDPQTWLGVRILSRAIRHLRQ